MGEFVADIEHRTAMRVLDALDRWSERLSGHHEQRRAFPRKSARSVITIYFIEESTIPNKAGEKLTAQVWMRNLSRNGLSFIHERYLNLSKIIVCLDVTGSDPVGFHAEVVRSRQVHEGYWEYGVSLKERAKM